MRFSENDVRRDLDEDRGLREAIDRRNRENPDGKCPDVFRPIFDAGVWLERKLLEMGAEVEVADEIVDAFGADVAEHGLASAYERAATSANAYANREVAEVDLG